MSIHHQRDLQQIFAVTAMSTGDVERIAIWAKGCKAGYCGYGEVDLPAYLLAEYMDGCQFGAILRNVGD